jgi:hypothetical protein
MINVGIAGMGAVGKELIKIIPKEINLVIYTRSKNNFYDILECDIIIDVMDSLEKSEELFLNVIRSGKTLILCNKEFVWTHLDAIQMAKNKIYLHSIVCSKNFNEFPPLDNKNFINFLDKKLFKFRDGGAVEAAAFIKKDLERALNEI